MATNLHELTSNYGGRRSAACQCETSPVATGVLLGAKSPKQNSKPPKLKHKSVEFLSIFRMLSPPHKPKAPHRNAKPPYQWRTQKVFMGGFGSGSYGGHLYLVCAVCDVTI